MSLKRKVLDKGFVEFTGVLGTDGTFLDAHGRSELDSSTLKNIFLRLLEQDSHVFEHAVLQFRIKSPLTIRNECLKHRDSSISEIHDPYPNPEFYIPAYFKEYGTSTIYKNLSAKECHELYTKFDNFYTWIKNLYSKLVNKYNLTKEQAVLVFPEGRYVEFYWTINAKSLMEFLKFYLKREVNDDMEQYISIFLDFFSRKFPHTVEAFMQTVLKK